MLSDTSYQVPGQPKPRRRRPRVIVALVCLIILALAICVGWWVLRQLKPDTTIQGAPPHNSNVVLSDQQLYKEKDFNIYLPTTWQAISKPLAGTGSQSYVWQSSTDSGTGQTFNIYEDTIPTTFPVDRLLVVSGHADRLKLQGSTSPLCTSFTPLKSPASGQLGVLSSWQGVSFLCDERSQPWISIGTSSADGVNAVALTSPTTHVSHTFFFTYIDYTRGTDYNTFYTALSSLRMR